MNLFYDSCNFKIYLVTGGYNGKNIVSTEVMSSSGSHWKYVGNLPLAVRAPSGISVNHQIFVTGTMIKIIIYNIICTLTVEGHTAKVYIIS